MEAPILIKGAGELASGVAWRLVRAGFPVVMTEIARPLAVRRTVSFCEAVTLGAITVEGITARLAADATHVSAILAAGEVPVLVDPEAARREALLPRPRAIVDAVMAKRNLGTHLTDAPVVIGLGPGFTAGVDCHAVIETQRGHYLGRVYYEGSALPDTGIPAERGGHSSERIVRAPATGCFRESRTIGELVEAGDLLGYIDPVAPSAECPTPGVAPFPVYSAVSGLLRGLVRDGTPITQGVKIGDVDPVADIGRCHTISDKALAVAGGVLEALLALR